MMAKVRLLYFVSTFLKNILKIELLWPLTFLKVIMLIEISINKLVLLLWLKYKVAEN